MLTFLVSSYVENQTLFGETDKDGVLKTGMLVGKVRYVLHIW